MKWYCWVMLVYLASIILLCLWYLVDEERKKHAHHKKCEAIRKAHQNEAVQKSEYTAEELTKEFRKH